MKRVAVISDTHGLLRPDVIDAITGCDAIIHGGDINKQEITFAMLSVQGKEVTVEKIAIAHS